jgi:hypothetical protein
MKDALAGIDAELKRIGETRRELDRDETNLRKARGLIEPEPQESRKDATPTRRRRRRSSNGSAKGSSTERLKVWLSKRVGQTVTVDEARDALALHPPAAIKQFQKLERDGVLVATMVEGQWRVLAASNGASATQEARKGEPALT